MFEKASQPLKKCHSNFLGGHVHTYIYIYNVLGHTHNDTQVVPHRELSQ